MHLTVSGGVTSVVVVANSAQLATEQVHVAEQQRVLGIVPNFYVVYDPDPAPLTKKLKFSLALRAETDPVTFAGAAFVSALQQAGDTPDYQQGMAGYGQRLGANYATGFTDIMIGGALLPSLLHQDPRYFYQGTGSTRSRLVHALSAPFVARGDNGRRQPNYSSMGGDLAAGAISNAYEPASNRGAGLVFQNALVVTGRPHGQCRCAGVPAAPAHVLAAGGAVRMNDAEQMMRADGPLTGRAGRAGRIR